MSDGLVTTNEAEPWHTTYADQLDALRRIDADRDDDVAYYAALKDAMEEPPTVDAAFRQAGELRHSYLTGSPTPERTRKLPEVVRSWLDSDEAHKAARKLVALPDGPVECPDVLQALFDECATKMLMLADGAVVDPGRDPVSGSRSQTVPNSTLGVEIEDWWAGFNLISTNRFRLLVLLGMQRAVESYRRREIDRESIPGTMEYQKRVALDPRPNEVVQAEFAVSEKTLRRWRKQFGVLRKNGRPFAASPVSAGVCAA